MENQTPTFEEIQERIASGDQEAALAYVNNPEAFAPTAPEMLVEAQETTPMPDESDYVEIEPKTPSTELTEAPSVETTGEETTDEEFVNPLDEQRKVYDQLEKERIANEKALKDQLAQADEEKQALLKQVEEARIAAEQAKAKEEVEEEFSFFDDEADSGKPAVETAAPVEKFNVDSTDDLRKEFEALKQSVTEREVMDRAVSEYTQFWNSPEGKKLKPDSLDAKTAIRKLDEVYDSLVGKFGSEVDAKRMMHDMRNPETASIYKEKAGIELPEEYDKLYDSWLVNEYRHGYKVDPITGRSVKTGTRLDSMEDAYFLMNKSKMLFDAKMEVYNQVQEKVKARTESAQIPNPSAMQSFDLGSRMMDANYRTALLGKMKNAGYTMGAPLNTIKDPELRAQAAEFIKFANI